LIHKGPFFVQYPGDILKLHIAECDGDVPSRGPGPRWRHPDRLREVLVCDPQFQSHVNQEVLRIRNVLSRIRFFSTPGLKKF
jgi:hypothetical protein